MLIKWPTQTTQHFSIGSHINTHFDTKFTYIYLIFQIYICLFNVSNLYVCGAPVSKIPGSVATELNYALNLLILNSY